MMKHEGDVDLYLLPVPEAKIEAYKDQAQFFADVVVEHGGLAYREFRGEDIAEGFEARDGDVLTAAMADMSLMRYAGFETFVEAR